MNWISDFTPAQIQKLMQYHLSFECFYSIFLVIIYLFYFISVGGEVHPIIGDQNDRKIVQENEEHGRQFMPNRSLTLISC